MHQHLISYLSDNRDHIIENWLTETQVPEFSEGPEEMELREILHLDFYKRAFESVLTSISTKKSPFFFSRAIHIGRHLSIGRFRKKYGFIDQVQNGLHEAGLKAFMNVFKEDWDAGSEFSRTDRKYLEDLIGRSLSDFLVTEMGYNRSEGITKSAPRPVDKDVPAT
ncbi:MAG: hypothetical protein AAGH40_06815 [Verrucomicrobiota bacterium]